MPICKKNCRDNQKNETSFKINGQKLVQDNKNGVTSIITDARKDLLGQFLIKIQKKNHCVPCY